MINAILLTEKEWHKKLFRNLVRVNKAQWHLIDTKEDFDFLKVKMIHPDWIFVPHWSYKIPSEIFQNYNCVVFHMTDLPFGRGGSPLQNLIVRGYTETKITALKVNEGTDTGDIYLKNDLALYGTAEEIFLRASDVIESMIIEIMDNNIVPVPQKGDITYFKRRTPNESDVSQIETMGKVYDYIRMLDAEGYPKAFVEVGNLRIEFSRASLKSDNSIIADVRITEK